MSGLLNVKYPNWTFIGCYERQICYFDAFVGLPGIFKLTEIAQLGGIQNRRIATTMHDD